MSINIQLYTKAEFEHLLQMATELFPNYDSGQLERDLHRVLNSGKYRVYLAKDKEYHAGFMMASIRTDYVEGATSSPTGYLENIYVREAYRGHGLAKRFFKIAEKWVKEQGCTEMGSDTWLWNKESISFHKSLGFEEEDRLIHFIKKLE